MEGTPTVAASLDALIARPRHELATSITRADAAVALPSLLDEAESRLARDVPRGQEALAAVRDLADAVGDAAVRARARRLHARSLAMSNRFDEAIVAAGAAADAAEAAGDPVAAGRASMVMLHALARLGRHDEAIRVGTEARDRFEAAGEPELAAKADGNVGEAMRLAGDAASALAAFDRARAVLGGDARIAAPLENNRAQALLDLGRFGEAEAGFRRAHEGFAAAGMDVGAAIAEGNLADLMGRQGRVDEAVRHFEGARRFFERSGAAGDLARLEAERAELLATVGSADAAADETRRALVALRRHGLASEAARAAVGYARALVRIGRDAEARGVLDEAIRTAGPDAAHDPRLGLARGEAALAAGDVPGARELLVAALEDAAGRPADAAVLGHAAAVAELELGDLDAADARIADGLVVAESLGLRPLAAELMHLRGRLRRRQGRDAEARRDLEAALAHVEHVRGSLQVERFRRTFLASRTSVHDELVALLVDASETDPDAAADACDVSERSQARGLVDRLARGGRLGDVAVRRSTDPGASAIAERMRTARRELNALYAEFAAGPPRAGDANWRRRVLDAERRVEAEEERLAALDATGVLAPSPGITEIRARLAGDVRLVRYHVAPDRTTAWAVGRDEVAVRTIGTGRTELAEAVERLRFQMTRVVAYPDADRDDPGLIADARRELAWLHERLVAPVAASLAGARHIVVVPHGPLHAVPFHALHDGDGHLLERCDVSVLPAAGLLAAASNPPDPSRRHVVLGAADAVAPDIEAEIDAVAEALGDRVGVRRAGATSDDVLGSAVGAGILHLACHARFAELSPRTSGLRMADRWVGADELDGLDMRGTTVVLAGCDTGRTAAGETGELLGLQRSLLGAGARGLVVSRWLLHDASARAILADAYRRVGSNDGADLLPSLLGAQRAALRDRPHPALWAALAFVGAPS